MWGLFFQWKSLFFLSTMRYNYWLFNFDLWNLLTKVLVEWKPCSRLFFVLLISDNFSYMQCGPRIDRLDIILRRLDFQNIMVPISRIYVTYFNKLSIFLDYQIIWNKYNVEQNRSEVLIWSGSRSTIVLILRIWRIWRAHPFLVYRSFCHSFRKVIQNRLLLSN